MTRIVALGVCLTICLALGTAFAQPDLPEPTPAGAARGAGMAEIMGLAPPDPKLAELITDIIALRVINEGQFSPAQIEQLIGTFTKLEEATKSARDPVKEMLLKQRELLLRGEQAEHAAIMGKMRDQMKQMGARVREITDAQTQALKQNEKQAGAFRRLLALVRGESLHQIRAGRADRLKTEGAAKSPEAAAPRDASPEARRARDGRDRTRDQADRTRMTAGGFDWERQHMSIEHLVALLKEKLAAMKQAPPNP